MLTGLAARIVYAILAGVVTFIIVYILGAIVVHFDSSIGALIEKFAPLIGLLVGLWYFFGRPHANPPQV
jgi:hypothetical protein